MSKKWTQQDIPDLTGKVAIVTGANSGLGLESTRALGRNGATVIMACRSMRKAAEARAQLLRELPSARLEVMVLDNASLAAVRAFAKAFKAQYDRLDILLNNAGVMAIPREETEEGFEMQLGVNHLAHFALTGLLLDRIVGTPGARVHNTASSAAFAGQIYFDDPMLKADYGRWKAYGQSKLANVLFANELNRRLSLAGHDAIANSSHPGLVMTNLQANSLEQSGGRLLERLMYRLAGRWLAQDVSMGVLPQLYAVTAPAARGGAFYGPHIFRLRGYPVEQHVNDSATDPATLERFWALSEELTGISYL